MNVIQKFQEDPGRGMNALHNLHKVFVEQKVSGLIPRLRLKRSLLNTTSIFSFDFQNAWF